jgi:hypothetical protein
MTLYLVNESRQIDCANDLSVYSDLDQVSLAIEPIDVENNEYFIFDTDGQFYSIKSGGSFNDFSYAKTVSDVSLVRKLILDYLIVIGRGYDKRLSLEENAARIGLDG